ncbi:hypothetical protein BJ546DRAFT_1048339 [Cryomyces antarcticus]
MQTPNDAMEEEEDDFYAPNGNATQGQGATGTPGKQDATNGQTAVKDEKMEDELEEGEEEEEEEEDDSGSDIDIITERKDGSILEPPSHVRTASFTKNVKPENNRGSSTDKISTRTQQPTPLKTERTSTPTARRPSTTQALKDGNQYPEIHSSTVDVNGNPVYSPVGKRITEVDIDADLAEHSKPWRLPGADQSDYFNYGFDEFTWTQYCLRQKTMKATLETQKAETKQFEMMFGMPGGGMPVGMPPMPGMPGMPSMSSMPGMPSGPQQPPTGPAAQQNNSMQASMNNMAGMMGMDMTPEMMQQMTQQMMAQGMTDPSQLDFGTFMQQMQAMQGGGGGGAGGSMPPTGPQSMQQQHGQGGYQQGGQNQNQNQNPNQQNQQGAYGQQQGYGQQGNQQQSYGQQQQANQGQNYGGGGGGGTPQPQNGGYGTPQQQQQQQQQQQNQQQQQGMAYPVQGQGGFEGYSAQQLAMMGQGAGGGGAGGAGGRGGFGRGRRGGRW